MGNTILGANTLSAGGYNVSNSLRVDDASNDFLQSLKFPPWLTGPNDMGAMCTQPTKSKTGRLGSNSEIFFDLKLSASART